MLVFRNTATGEVSSTDPASGTANTAAGQSGYGMRAGDWKLVVPHCLSKAMVPSVEDQSAFEIYHLPSDPFEAHNLNDTVQGRANFETMLSIANKYNVSCCAYQGHSGSALCSLVPPPSPAPPAPSPGGRYYDVSGASST